jgi:hypothetical protein
MHFYFVLGAFAFFVLVFFLYSPMLIFGFWQKSAGAHLWRLIHNVIDIEMKAETF